MHFSIPETSEIKDVNQGNFTVYHIHANGVLHCKLRFKQFNSLHEQLKKQFGIYSLPYFPPKKLFALKELEIEERRAVLEKYIQIISQDERISNSRIFNDFLLNAQQSTLNASRESIKLDILLADNSHLNCKLMSTDNSNTIKESICRELKLPIKYTPFFSLFIAKQQFDDSNSRTLSNQIDFLSNQTTNRSKTRSSFQLIDSKDKFINSSSSINKTNLTLINHQNRSTTDFKYILIRKLMDFESPYLSLLNANKSEQIYHLKLIKFYWDVELDDKLIDNEIALNLIYLQAVNDLKQHKSTDSNRDHYKYLETLALRQSKKEYIIFARTVKNYGQMWFEPCICDFPKPNTNCIISIKSNELILRTFLNGNSTNNKLKYKDFILRITRIRVWRLTTGFDLIKNNVQINDNDDCKSINSTNQLRKNSNTSPSINTSFNTSFLINNQEDDFKYELSIEYLISKDDLRWIVIKSEQAILMSTCLKSIIEELVLKKNKLPIYDEKSSEINVDLRKNSCNYYKSNDSSLNDLDFSNRSQMEKSLSVETFLVKSTNKTKFVNNQLKNRKVERTRSLVKNSVYDGIGDDDL